MEISLETSRDIHLRVNGEQEQAIRALFAHYNWDFELIGEFIRIFIIIFDV